MKLLETIVDNRYTLCAAVLFVIGMLNMMLQQNMIKKVVAFNIMDASTFLFLATRGFVEGRVAAIIEQSPAEASRYVNPIPAGLVLTGIVVSVSVSAFSLALIQRIYALYGTLDMRELVRIQRKRGEI